MVIWLVGLSGSGKSTLGHEIAKQLRKIKTNTVLLDGDEVREVFLHNQNKEAYTIKGRQVNAERITALCKLLDKQGIHVVCCILSIFPEMRALNRTQFSQYFEIYMKAPLEVLKRRDVKGLYASAEKGEVKNVVGIDIPFEAPSSPDLTIDSTNEDVSIHQLASQTIKLLGIH